jgi:hypothetical protein
MVGKFTETLIADDKRAGSKCMVGAAYTKITRGIKAAGYTIGDSAVSKHVAGQCSCG